MGPPREASPNSSTTTSARNSPVVGSIRSKRENGRIGTGGCFRATVTAAITAMAMSPSSPATSAIRAFGLVAKRRRLDRAADALSIFRGYRAGTGLPVKSHDREELDFFIDALEPHEPSILEGDAGPRNQIAEDTRDQHFVRCSDTHDPRPCDDHQPCDLSEPTISACPTLSPQRISRPRSWTPAARAHAQRMAPARSSKAAKKPSPAVSSSRPPNRLSSFSHESIVALEECLPCSVAELGCDPG